MRLLNVFLRVAYVQIALALPLTSLALEPEKLFHDAGTEFVKISPSGSKFALLRRDGKTTSLIVTAIKSKKVLSQYSVGDRAEENYLVDFNWIDEKYIAVETSESIAGIDDLKDSKAKQYLRFYDTDMPDLRPKVVATKGSLLHSLPHEKGKFLYQRSGNVSSVYKIDTEALAGEGAVRSKLDPVDGGQFTQKNRVAHVDGYAMSWFINGDGVIDSVLTMNRDRVMQLQAFSDEQQYQAIATWDLNRGKRDKKVKKGVGEKSENAFIPYLKAAKADEYYVFDLHENPTSTIYIEDYKTKSRRKLYDSGGLKILGLILSSDNEFLGVRLIANDRIEYRYSDGGIVDLGATENSRVVSQSSDGKTQAVFISSFNRPGEFFLTRNGVKTEHIGFANEGIQQALPGTQINNSIVSNGVEVFYLLNVPESKASRYPLIIMPHGGPFGAFDSPYYDAGVQFWLLHDFAVLRVNFRGSGGRGKDYEDLGRLQYGLGMLDDIVNVTKAVSGFPSIDAARMCVFGMSYGGYAAMMLTLKHPELYRCGVSFAGISDLNLFLHDRKSSEESKKWMDEYIGNPQADYDRLKAQSPLYLLDKLHVPWLVMQGSNDGVVDQEHFHRLRLYNEQHQKDIDFELIEGLGHSFESGENALKIYEAAFQFVSERLNNGR